MEKKIIQIRKETVRSLQDSQTRLFEAGDFGLVISGLVVASLVSYSISRTLNSFVAKPANIGSGGYQSCACDNQRTISGCAGVCTGTCPVGVRRLESK